MLKNLIHKGNARKVYMGTLYANLVVQGVHIVAILARLPMRNNMVYQILHLILLAGCLALFIIAGRVQRRESGRKLR